MKYWIIISTLLYSCSTPAQTWSLNSAKDSVLSINKRVLAIQQKQSLKDINDDIRNAKIKAIEQKLDSAVSPDLSDFNVDRVTKVLSLKEDAFITIKKSSYSHQSFADMPTVNNSQKAYTLTVQRSIEQQQIDVLKTEVDKLKKALSKQQSALNKLKKGK